MNEKLISLGKLATGIVVGAVAAELVAIGANAAVQDFNTLRSDFSDRFYPNPEPVKARGFHLKKKNNLGGLNEDGKRKNC